MAAKTEGIAKLGETDGWEGKKEKTSLEKRSFSRGRESVSVAKAILCARRL